MMDRRAGERAWMIAPFAALAGIVAVLVARGVFYHAWLQDIFIPLGGVIHLQHGEWPHRDFGTPVGSLYYLIHYLPTLVAPLSGRTVIWASAIVAATATGFAVVGARKRLPAWLAALFGLYVGMVAISPRQIGEPLTYLTNNASYNRWSWALAAVLAMVVGLPPRGENGRTATRDGIAAGLLLTMLFFIKVTYFAAGIGLVAVAAGTVRRPQAVRLVGMAALTVAAIVVLVQLGTGLVGAYLWDLRQAAAVQPHDGQRVKTAYQLLVAFAPGGLLVLLLGLAATPAGATPPARYSPLVMALATFAAGLLIAIQNHPEFENPLLPAAALIAWFAGPAAGRAAVPLSRRFPLQAAPLTIAGLFLIPLVQDVGASLWAGIADAAQGPEVRWLAGTPLRDVRIAAHGGGGDNGSTTLDNDVEFAAALHDGAALLDRHLHGRRDAAVMPLTWSNPWPVLMGLRPVRHELAWWDPARTFNERIKPDPRFLDRVDFVLVPVRYFNSGTVDALRATYASDLAQRFRPVERTREWTLMARRDCATRRLC